MKQLSILGSTGSIGRSTLQIVEKFTDRFKVRALAAKTNVALLAEQIDRFKPDLAVVFDSDKVRALKQLLPVNAKVEILEGSGGYAAAASYAPVDTVVAAIVGAAGLMPALAAIDAGKDIALANKETLVMAGEIVMKKAAAKGVRIFPVDSEHSAVFQCLEGQSRKDLKCIHLTASGGPFFKMSLRELESISPDEALDHPTWQMGPKISIDSATLMNKGLEVIEAQHLFAVPTDIIEIVVHPQSLIHSMVSFRDGSVLAQIGIPDMKGAIAYALSYPERLPLEQPVPDFAGIGALKFKHLNLKKFPCLKLALEAARNGETYPAVLNAANEVAVYAFLDRRIDFLKIAIVIEKVLEVHTTVPNPNLEDILEADGWARRQAEAYIEKLQK